MNESVSSSLSSSPSCSSPSPAPSPPPSSSTATATPTPPRATATPRAETLQKLLDAAKRSDVERLNAVLDSHANDDLVNVVSPKRREAALHVAARVGSASVASALLARGANVDVRQTTQTKCTPLHVAAEHGNADVASLLLSKGAAIEATDRWRGTALHLAARRDRRSVVELLLEHGARVEAKDEDGSTPLMSACWAGAASVVALLVERGVDVDVQTPHGRTPLLLAADSGACAPLALLLSHGVDVNKTAHDGTTALHLAVRKECVGVVRALLAHGADVEAPDDTGDRPLHAAARRNVRSSVNVLLVAGADIAAAGDGSRTAEQCAAFERHHTVTRTLRNFAFLLTALLPRLVRAARALLSARVFAAATPTLPLPHALVSLVVERLALAEIAERAPRFADAELEVDDDDDEWVADQKQHERLTAPPDLRAQLSTTTDARARTQLSRLAATVVAFAARRPVAPQSRAQFAAPFRRDLVLLAAARPDDDDV